MPTSEFVVQLRDIAIKADARPQVLDCIDSLFSLPTEDEIEKRIHDAEEAAEDDHKNYVGKQWANARSRAVFALNHPDIGLTETQLDQVLEVIDRMEP